MKVGHAWEVKYKEKQHSQVTGEKGVRTTVKEVPEPLTVKPKSASAQLGNGPWSWRLFKSLEPQCMLVRAVGGVYVEEHGNGKNTSLQVTYDECIWIFLSVMCTSKNWTSNTPDLKTERSNR